MSSRADLTDEQLENQMVLDRSWAGAQRLLADPEFRGYLDSSLRRLDSQRPPSTLTAEEFLARTELDTP